VLLVGGDYMTFGRMLVLALAPLGLALGVWVDDAPRRGVAVVVALALGLAAGWGVEPLQAPVRDALHYRGTTKSVRSELGMWRFMKNNAVNWSKQGKALAKVTAPGERLVTGAIGARGYYSNLFILDRGGLVVAEVNERPFKKQLANASPGHDRTAPREFFLPWEPEYLAFFAEPGKRRVAEARRRVSKLKLSKEAKAVYGPTFRETTVDGVPFRVALVARMTPAEARAAWAALTNDGKTP